MTDNNQVVIAQGKASHPRAVSSAGLDGEDGMASQFLVSGEEPAHRSRQGYSFQPIEGRLTPLSFDHDPGLAEDA